MSKTLILLRGLPGSGKSTLGELIAGGHCFAADDYFDEYFDGDFIPANLPEAHKYCKDNVSVAMTFEAEIIAVSNTFTQEWEMKDYLDLAKKYGYTVHTIIVENRHGNESIHNVPEQTIEKMCKRFQIKL